MTGAPRQVLVLWDEDRDRPGGKTHDLNCHRIDGFHWVTSPYRKVDVTEIPDSVGRCGFCGGGRPAPKNPQPIKHPKTTAGTAPATPPEPVGAIGVGSTARVRNEQTGELHTWTIVSAGEQDTARGRLSKDSPIAKAVLGHVAGETVTAITPRGERQYTIAEVT